MALIKCPECEKEISDKAKKCPNCGYKSKTDFVEKYKSKILKYSIIAVVIVVALVSTILGINAHKKKKYKDEAKDIMISILNSASDCEELANLTGKVWYNAIYEKSDATTNKYTIKSYYYNSTKTYYSDSEFVDDFNTALLSLFVDKKTSIESIENKSKKIDEIMAKLDKYPKSLENIHNALFEYYYNYQELVEIATNPTGSYTEFSKNRNEVINNVTNSYKRLKTMLPDK